MWALGRVGIALNVLVPIENKRKRGQLCGAAHPLSPRRSPESSCRAGSFIIDRFLEQHSVKQFRVERYSSDCRLLLRSCLSIDQRTNPSQFFSTMAAYPDLGPYCQFLPKYWACTVHREVAATAALAEAVLLTMVL